jgi:hypothetical protein
MLSHLLQISQARCLLFHYGAHSIAKRRGKCGW